MTALTSFEGHLNHNMPIVIVLLLSLTLNMWGIRWGAPQQWHPDEITGLTISMVAERSINPHNYPYGHLHYYVLAVGAVIPVYAFSVLFDPPPSKTDTAARARWWEPRLATMMVIARIISAVMSTAVVFFTYVIGRILFDKQTAYLSALFLSISVAFISVAHFATVDSPANFWYWLSCLSSLLIWKKGDWRWYVLGALTAGFAIGIKVDRVVVLVPLTISMLLRREPVEFRKVSGVLSIVGLGYLLANLALFTSFFESVDGITRDLFYNALRSGDDGSSHLQVVERVTTGLGWPLFISAVCGLFYGLFNLVGSRNAHAIWWLFAAIVPYFVLFSSMGVQPWYIPFFLPALAVLAARAWTDLLNAVPKPSSWIANAALGVVVLYTFLYALAVDLQFSNDSRLLASKWIDANVPKSARIEVGEWGPFVSGDRYTVVYSRRDAGTMDFAIENRKRLEQHAFYSRFRRALLASERWAGQTFSIPIREKPYTAWFDREHARTAAPAIGENNSPADYVMLNEDLNSKKIQQLMGDASGYRLRANFKYVDPLGLSPAAPFVNPPIYVFQRVVSH